MRQKTPGGYNSLSSCSMTLGGYRVIAEVLKVLGVGRRPLNNLICTKPFVVGVPYPFAFRCREPNQRKF